MILCIPDIYANSRRDHRHQRAAELLARLGLEGREHHKPGELSGGQQQRVSIARALINGGEIILADEPTGALDSQSGREVLAILCELNRRGHTVVMVTHDMDVARHAQRIIELRDGEIISDNGRHIPGTESLPLPAVVRPRRRLYLSDRFRESLYMALKTMNAHRLRTALTMTGIVFGIAAVVTVVALGEGARQRTLESIRDLGTNVISIYPGHDFFDDSNSSPRPLVPADAAALAKQGLMRWSPPLCERYAGRVFFFQERPSWKTLRLLVSISVNTLFIFTVRTSPERRFSVRNSRALI
ncbi:ATP-binding cassette domain-containing protein [Salmonella enterica subsp. enterica serovar Java]|nr:ATP-binding cassette domain-containing protein [Salmonella enterica subsp. enterica serovar Java]